MRLRKLLLGSAAAVMAVGSASGSAQAADPMSGLVTATANYLESCSSGKGIQFTDWCFRFSGSATATYEFGWELDYGTSPYMVTKETVNGDPYAWPPIVGLYPWDSSLSVKLGLTATRETPNGKTITVKVPISGSGSTSLAISRPGGYTWTFTSSSITLKVPSNIATFTFRVESGPLAPFWPNFRTTVNWSGGNVDVKLVGQIGFDTFNDGAYELAPEVDLEVGFDLGAVEVDLAARYDKVEVVGIVGGVSAYAVGAGMSAEMGNADVTVGVVYARDSNQWTSYNYSPAGGSTAGYYFRAFSDGVFTWNSNHRTTFKVAYNYGPVAFDGQLEFGVAHRIRPYGSSVLSITPALTYERAYTAAGTPIGAFSAKLTISVPIN